MTDKLILAIDQGTTNTKVLLVDRRGTCVAQSSCPVDISFPRPAWVEQDPLAIWQSVQQAIDTCLQAAGDPPLAAIGISNQRESGLIWERASGKPVGPLVSWQCRRGTALCDSLRDQKNQSLLLERTGLALDPMFTASKIRWLLDNIPDGHKRAAAGELCAGTVDSWLLWNFTGGAAHRCDVSNASRTLLFNIETLRWDEDLLELFGVPAAILPEVCHSSFWFGETVQLGRLAAGIPVASMIGDSHAALFGHASFKPGSVKATYGTGSSLMTRITELTRSSHGISTTVAWGYQGVAHALEGNILVTGAAVQWLGDVLGALSPSQVADLAASVESTEGVYLVPALVGLGAPHWNADARGLLTGLTRGTTSRHIARAVIESIAYQIRDVFDVMAAETGGQLQLLLADGGMTRNNMLMQFQADILGCPVQRNNTADLSAMGAAYLAGLTVGMWASLDEIEALPRSTDRFEPQLTSEAREALYSGWKEAIARTIYKPA